MLSARKADPYWLPFFYSQLDALGINENLVLGRDPDHPRAQVPGAPPIPPRAGAAAAAEEKPSKKKK